MFGKGKTIFRKAVKSLSRSSIPQETEETMANEKHNSIDESLYSRQLYVMGHEAQRRMASSNVLIYGMNGLGVEIAKNVILAGVKSVTILDQTPTTLADLGAQFYLTKDDVGKPRAQACVERLAELNNYVQVKVAGEDVLSEAFLKQFTVVVMTQGSLDEKISANEICHANDIKFISGQVNGLFCQAFCDFGSKFIVTDTTGEEPKSSIVASVSKGKDGVVAVHDDAMHGLETGDFVRFTEIVGMEALNNQEPVEIKVTGPFTFEIGDTSNFGDYKHGGYVTQVKMPKEISFLPLKESIKSPEFLLTDFAKFGRSELLHFGFQALDSFKKKHGRYPAPGSSTESDEVVSMAHKLSSEAGEGCLSLGHEPLDDAARKLLSQLASGSSAVLSPICAFLGGVLGQEVLKACSGKFTPLHQWMCFDAVECLPSEPLSEEDVKPENSRYDDEIAVFGRPFVNKLRGQSVFLVGAGAIGCEMLKNWACMGIATQGDSLIHVTDMDSIEKSNLNRQFLFRPKDVGSAKSRAAGEAIKAINPEVNVKAYEEKVAPETEKLFGDDFMAKIDAICTALDNVDARLYVDQRCLTYEKPMLESGTLGTKGNTQIIVPGLTENYGASRDPPEKSVPVCTLKNFPNKIEHTIQFARDWFEGVFTQQPNDANQYLNDPGFLKQLEKQMNSKVETLENVLNSLVKSKPLTFDECIAWARLQFESNFNHTIKQLLHNFPPGSTTSSGNPFWSGTKREPSPLVFDIEDDTHMAFIIAAANLRAFNYGLKGETQVEVFRAVLPSVAVPDFRPKNVKIAENDTELKNQQENTDLMDVDTVAQQIVEKLPDPKKLVGYKLNPAEFEKDDDSNHHIDFITAASNLRARCYKITPEADKHTTKKIAGKIIPAIATTTALVTGLVCLEYYKIIAGKKTVEDYKSGFVNLALPLFAFSEPVACEQFDGPSGKWTIWDKIVVDGSKKPLTLKEFIQYFKDEYKVEISMLSCGVSILHSFFQSASKTKERLPMTMPELVAHVTKKPIDPNESKLAFEICATDADDEDVDLPPIFYKMK